jgi:hypothetical protein
VDSAVDGSHHPLLHRSHPHLYDSFPLTFVFIHFCVGAMAADIKDFGAADAQ